MSPGQSNPLPNVDPTGLETIRTCFVAADFTESRIAEALGGPADRAVPDVDVPYYLSRMGDDTPFSVLVRLFVIDDPIGDDELAKTGLDRATLDELGLAQTDSRGLRSSLRIVPFGDLYIAWDWEARGVTRNFVTGINGTSRLLADLTIRSPRRVAADIATGSGIHALAAARHCDHVVATDMSQRALDIARFNAALNHIDNVEFRRGDLFEPLADERFDLILCNPPFVVSPDNDYDFRDDGRDADGISEELVRGLSAHLERDGVAQFLCSWMRLQGESDSERLESWLPTDCDAICIVIEGKSPLDYAAQWNLLLRARGRDAVDEALTRWTSYFESKATQEIVYGSGVLRKTPDREPVRVVQRLPGLLRGSAGDQFARILRFLQVEGEVLDVIPIPVPHRITRERVVQGSHAEETFAIEPLDGLPLRHRVDDLTVDLIGSLDGKRTLREVAADIARMRGYTRDRFAAMCTDVVTALGRTGLFEVKSDM